MPSRRPRSGISRSWRDRCSRPPAGSSFRAAGTQWIVPVENLAPPLEIPEACLRSMPRGQRRATRDAIRDSRNRRPLPGVVVVEAGCAGRNWPLPMIRDGHALAFAELHRPDAQPRSRCAASSRTASRRSRSRPRTARSSRRARGERRRAGAGPARRRLRPARPHHLDHQREPARVRARSAHDAGLDKPCEPPSRKSIGQRRTPPPSSLAQGRDDRAADQPLAARGHRPAGRGRDLPPARPPLPARRERAAPARGQGRAPSSASTTPTCAPSASWSTPPACPTAT